jgi:hypothetical protein
MKIEEGKFYKDREGEVQGPAVRREGKVLYTFKVGDTSYSDKGEFITGATSDQDLIEEVPDPSLPKPVPVEIPPAAEPVETAPATPDAPDLGEVEIHPSRLSDSMEAYRASEKQKAPRIPGADLRKQISSHVLELMRRAQDLDALAAEIGPLSEPAERMLSRLFYNSERKNFH